MKYFFITMLSLISLKVGAQIIPAGIITIESYTIYRAIEGTNETETLEEGVTSGSIEISESGDYTILALDLHFIGGGKQVLQILSAEKIVEGNATLYNTRTLDAKWNKANYLIEYIDGELHSLIIKHSEKRTYIQFM